MAVAGPKNPVVLSRAGNRQWVLKPQDLAVALWLVARRGEWLPYAALGKATHLSQFEAHAAVQRSMAAGLVAGIEGPPRVVIAALRAFVIHGARYAYPPVRGGITIGFQTAPALPAMKKRLGSSSNLVTVWPHPEGNTRGQSLLPLYESLPLAARDAPEFRELLVLFDLLRIGQARERGLAQKLLEEHLQ